MLILFQFRQQYQLSLTEQKINPNYAKINFTSGNPRNVGGSFAFINDYVVYTHNEEWPVNTKIAGSISNLKDYLGKDIASFSFEFTTTANVVKSISPANNAAKVEVNTPIEITFNAKMNTNQNLLDLVKVIDNRGNSIITDSKQFSWKSASNGDILTINNISLQPSNRYVVQLSENLLDKDGSKLSGNRVFSFSTRGAVYLQFEPSNYYHALSDINFKVCGEGSVTDVSNANVALTCNGVNGKLLVSGNYIVFKLDSNNQWPFGADVTIKLSNLTDSKSAKISDVSATFNVINQTEISLMNADSIYNSKQNLIFDYTNKEYSSWLDLTEAKIQFANASVSGNFTFNQGKLSYKLNDNQFYPTNTKVRGSITGIKDQFGLNLKDYGFEFTTGYFVDGDGTEQNPYLITNADDLNNIRYLPKYNNYYFKQTQDIDLIAYGTSYDSGKGWLPIENLNGYYDGDNHKITNLFMNRPKETVGLFNSIQGSVKNLGIEVSAKGVSGHTGGVLANHFEGINLENCWVGGSGSIDCVGDCSALVCDIYAEIAINNCYSTINVEGHGIVGGLFAQVSCESVNNCYSSGNVKNNYNIGQTGGLIGNGGGTIKNCYSTSNVTGGEGIGGLVGRAEGINIDNCYSSGNLSSGSLIGGLVGDFSNGKIINSFSSSNVVDSSAFSGGFIGSVKNDCIISNCYSTGNISGESYNSGGFVGGIFTGYGNNSFINCYSLGNVSGSWSGGFIGMSQSYKASNQFINCYVGCLNVEYGSTDSELNRFIGYNNPDAPIIITNCYANKSMKLIKNGVTTQPGLQNPLPDTVALDGVDGANLPDNPDWKNEIFKDGYEEGTSFDDIWEIGTSGLPILKNMPGSPLQ